MDHEISVKENTRRFWEFLRPYKRIFFFLIFLSLVLQFIIVADRYLLKIVIDAGEHVSAGTLGAEGFIEILFVVLFIYAGLVAMNAVRSWLSIHNLNRLDQSVVADLKRAFFNHLLHLDYDFHTTHKAGQLISRITRGGKSVEGMLDSLMFNIVPLVFQLIVAFFFIATVHLAAAFSLVVFIIIFLVYTLWMYKGVLEDNIRANTQEDTEKADIGDFFANMDSIKYYGKERRIKKRYWDLSERTRIAYLRLWDHFKKIDVTQTIILGAGTIVISWLPIAGFLAGQNTMGDVAFVFSTWVGAIGWVYGFTFGVRNYYRAMADFESLYEYKKEQPTIKDLKGAGPLKVEKGLIEFKNVSFSYTGKQLFDNFSLTVRPTMKVALVGHSGAGKSTIVKLLYRLYDIDGGSIRIDGTDIRDVKQESLRSELAIVPQEAILFDDTIYNNVAFSRSGATRDEVLRAMRFAQLDRLVENLPNKEKTIVGERGVKLSGGEKQRVSIARAILADKKVLVLDEATSSLDSQTEKEIQDDLARLMEGRTAIIIAHRLSTIMSADNIVVLSDGKAVQQGTHEELIKQEGHYKHLWELQRGGYIE